MNVEMWAHPATEANVKILRERGVHFVDPGEGYLACRTVGAGRLAEPGDIVARALTVLQSGPARRPEEAVENGGDLRGQHVLITAGPTYEAIDPVRGITNRSSGKMGYNVAEAALARGAEVTLVSGPVSIEAPSGARILRVRSAAEMFDAVMASLERATIVIMAAAVADYRPARSAHQKIKKNGRRMTVELEPTEDILATVGGAKGDRVVIGFAAETENVVGNARKKLLEKGADLIIANDVSRPDSGFDVETNRITIVTNDGVDELPLLTKKAAAERILDSAVDLVRARSLK
jgi:phosphopantothenoylcysteine decarboxylase/phosphopantothenate--cysteine ligase